MKTRALCLLTLIFAAAPIAAHAQEQRDLQGMAIVGSRESPKTLFIVPWKQAELGTLLPPPESGLIERPIAPLDPEVFRRELQYRSGIRAE